MPGKRLPPTVQVWIKYAFTSSYFQNNSSILTYFFLVKGAIFYQFEREKCRRGNGLMKNENTLTEFHRLKGKTNTWIWIRAAHRTILQSISLVKNMFETCVPELIISAYNFFLYKLFEKFFEKLATFPNITIQMVHRLGFSVK